MNAPAPRDSSTDPLGVGVLLAENPSNLGIEWDAENRLLAVKEGAATLASFVYSGVGQRFQKSASGVTKTYVYDDRNHIIEERLSSGGTIRYWYGLYVDDVTAKRETDDSVYYYTKDHLGSVREVTMSSGSVSFRRDYDPSGSTLSGGSTSGISFTGREWDAETELYYYRARYYEPTVGRFLSEDPLGLDGSDTNFYAYVRNNPIRLTDPLGLAPSSTCCDWLGCVANCLAQYDPLGPRGNLVLTAAGGTFPKAWIGAPSGYLGSTGAGATMTTVPSAFGGGAVRGVGRFFSPIWITYGVYLFFMEVHCYAACAGYACSY